MLLDPRDQFSFPDVLVVGLEGNSLHQLEVIPVDVALLHLLARLLLLPP